jgi:hypothetical protein
MSDAETPERPYVAGMYDYALGGTENTAADRAAVERIKELSPDIIFSAWANRGFLQRAVHRLATEWNVRQFIDIGAGLPTQRHTHEVVADSRPDFRVVYVDNDPRVIARGSEILAGVDGATVIEADITKPDEILGHPETRRLIDFTEPVAVLMVSVIQFVQESEDPWALVRRYLDAVPSGSYLVLSVPTSDHQAERVVDGIRQVYARTPTQGQARSRAETERFFDGLEIVPPYPGAEPAVTYVGLWGAEDPEAADDEGNRWLYAAVGRKP